MRQQLFIILLSLCVSFTIAQESSIIKSPAELPLNDQRLKIFLGGSIDMGNSENWQEKLEEELSNSNIVLLNPRREDWNKDWQPISTDSNFRVQVEWELEALEFADIIVMYFAPNSQSPISLLEFGLYAKTQKLIVLCPEGFWRKGNVDIVAEKYNVQTVQTFEELISELQTHIDDF